MASSILKLKKFLSLERERHFDNRAVVGGLDKVIPIWQKEALSDGLDEEVIASIVLQLQRYSSLDVSSREETIKAIFNALDDPEGPKPVEGIEPDPSEESKPAPQPRVPHRLNIDLNAPVTVIPGVSKQKAAILARLGLHTLEDVLYYFPRRYDDYSRMKPINRLTYGEEVTVLGTIVAVQTRPIRGGKSQLTEAVLSDGTGTLRLSWFNQPWREKALHQGDQVTVSGKLDMYLGRLVMNMPEVEELEKEHLHTSGIIPVYSLTSSISQKQLRSIIHEAVRFCAPRMEDYLPESIRLNLKLMDLGVALYQVHFPDSQDTLDQARWRLAFDEIFLLQLGVLRQKYTWKRVEARRFDTPSQWLEEQISRLPFPLTGAQRRALDEIARDLQSGRPMDRLLQGDVGSGKTVVAALGMAMVMRHGAQAALMAPTSILAEQHYRNLSRLLTAGDEHSPALLSPEEIRLLVGDTRESEKEEIRTLLAEGKVKLVIGTHSLIEDPITFQDLQMVVIDEQHRFGVAQRALLRAKGNNPHLLVMTATPIPRSLALTIYGDLDLSIMDEMPPGRQPVETHVLHPLERERAYQLIRSQIQAGYQAFIIYPMIEQNGDNGKAEALAAVEEHQKLQREVFPNLRIGLLHGKMRPDEKDEVMARFRDGEFHILVSTSVVEVGVDIPNATVMLVEGANRFGLAQLHQFRGRVGRGNAKAYCLLIPDHEDALENERLAAMAETSDGFVLAEYDLEQRGPGEFLGTRQAGYSELKMAKLTDVKLIEKARQQAQAIFEKDPDLAAPEHAALTERLNRFWGAGRGDIS
ncbi:ATP-dependent DNA helicase RecG [Anaerolinea thermolimosa]|uniref:ATP-dependent DNA helicase RecG n=1 Tax=Anaerolinea thermolimosa TaxID=229919 RepID=UPI0007855AC8|nr:ATP-dependent DNA helicase RecG [Anaerolinea thermolimosa]GAP06791.1 ATP-dependent DNA helicase RecG [Anaerolinea thermolimosa]